MGPSNRTAAPPPRMMDGRTLRDAVSSKLEYGGSCEFSVFTSIIYSKAGRATRRVDRWSSLEKDMRMRELNVSDWFEQNNKELI